MIIAGRSPLSRRVVCVAPGWARPNCRGIKFALDLEVQEVADNAAKFGFGFEGVPEDLVLVGGVLEFLRPFEIGVVVACPTEEGNAVQAIYVVQAAFPDEAERARKP